MKKATYDIEVAGCTICGNIEHDDGVILRPAPAICHKVMIGKPVCDACCTACEYYQIYEQCSLELPCPAIHEGHEGYNNYDGEGPCKVCGGTGFVQRPLGA